MTWRNRIVATEERDPRTLVPNPRNWRRHPRRQAEAMRATLGTLGWVAPVVVNQTTGHIVDGHLRCELAAKLGVATVPVAVVALTVEEEQAALATLDPLGDLAVADAAALDALLVDLGDNDLLAALSDAADLVEDAPEEPQEATDGVDYTEMEEDPATEDSGATGAANAEQARYPLAIVLTQADHRTWKRYKQSLGVSGDTTAFLKLMEGADA